jgi:type IV secretion system protein VirB9
MKTKVSILITLFSASILFSCSTAPKKSTDQVPLVPNPIKKGSITETNADVDFSKSSQQKTPDQLNNADTNTSSSSQVVKDDKRPSEDKKGPSKVEIKVVDYTSPEEALAASRPNNDKLSDPSSVVESQNVLFEVKPSVENYQGGAVIWNYIPNHIYRLYVAPYQTTNIELAPGEKIVNAPYAGDTVNFVCGTSYFIEEGKERQQVLIKGVFAGKITTLNIPTDQRNYMFRVITLPRTFMPLVSFNYPLEMAENLKAAADAQAKEIPVSAQITDLDFGYSIIPHSIHAPHWEPSIVFNDGKKTYINFASAARASYAPVLFDISEKDKRLLVNYRVKGTYFIVDRVLYRFELVLDVNEGNIITVVHKD